MAVWVLLSGSGYVHPALRSAVFQRPPLSTLSGAVSRPLWMLAAETKAADVTLADGEEIGPDGVICARGVCVIAEPKSPEMCFLDEDDGQVKCETNPDADGASQWWPSALLLGCSVLYGTNFPLGRLMNEALPASATSSARFLLAAIALSPFLFQLNPAIRLQAMRCGAFTALGYISQSIALVDTSAATVSFLGALIVVWNPLLEAFVDKRPKGFDQAPQTWIAAALALSGVALLELAGEGGLGNLGWGDFWSVLQAVGFGTSFFITEKMMARDPSQALPITAAQCAVVAAVTAVWAGLDGLVLDGWMLDEGRRTVSTLPGLLFDPSMRTVAAAVLWTGLVTTAANRLGETTALGKLSSSEASVLLSTEPLWAALFAAGLLGEALGWNDGAGGALIVSACLVNSASPQQVREFLRIAAPAETESQVAEDPAE